MAQIDDDPNCLFAGGTMSVSLEEPWDRMAHTPGPWFIVHSGPQDQGAGHYWSIIGPHGTITSVGAASQRGAVDMKSNQANAHLIAAAPELYAALDQLLDDMGDDGLSVCQAAKDQAKAALAKARGETA